VPSNPRKPPPGRPARPPPGQNQRPPKRHLTPAQARHIDELADAFPQLARATITEVYLSFPPNSQSEVAIKLLDLSASGGLTPLSHLKEIYPDLPDSEIEEALRACGDDISAASALLGQSVFSDSLPRPPAAVSNRIVYKSLIEVDMHGSDYSPHEWVSVIHLAVDDAISFGVDEVLFITGQGCHSDDGPILRPLTMAVLLRMNLAADIDRANPGLVRCELGKDARDEGIDDELVLDLHGELPEYSIAACQQLLAFARGDFEDAVSFAEQIDARLHRGWTGLVEGDRRETQRRTNVLYSLKQKFPDIPGDVVKKIAIENEFVVANAQAELVKLGNALKTVTLDYFLGLFSEAPHLPVARILEMARLMHSQGDAASMLAEQSMDLFRNARGAFEFKPTLRGKRADGSDRMRPILELDVSNAEQERAKRNILRVVQEMLDGDYQYGEIRFKTSWLNPRDVTVDWVAGVIRESSREVFPRIEGPVVQCKLVRNPGR
jgi:hypothetical protein